MSRSPVCAVVLLVIALVDFSSAGLLLANQTLKLDLACRAEKKTMLTCNDATINDLENALIAHLNDDINNRVPDKDCAFSLAGSTTCEEESIEFSIMLTCHGPRADGKLAEHIEQQQMAITRIMDRKTSEPFSSGNSTAICRLFRDSDQRKTPSAICSEDCTKEYQGPVALCDCPYVEVPEPSCNIPAVLVHISKVTSINRTSCDQVDPSIHSAVIQQISELVGPIRFQGLTIQLAPGSVSTSFHCNSSSELVDLNTLTSVIVKINTPFCSENISCIQEFSAKQLSAVEEFFLLLSSLMPELQPVSVGGVQLSESRPNVNVQLSCENGTALNADGACCFPGQCPRGSYIKDGDCRLCPIGQYIDEADQTQCQSCPGDQTTSGEGASDISYCIGSCLKGQYSPTGSTPCTPCPIGTHQRLPGQNFCTPCPPGYSTVKTGSTSLLDCSV